MTVFAPDTAITVREVLHGTVWAHFEETVVSNNGDDPAAMLEYSVVAGVGHPQEQVHRMKQLPFWESLVPLGRTVLHDGLCPSSQAPVPTDLLASITVPMLCIGSSGSPDWLRAGAEASATAPDGRFVVLEGEFHTAPASVLAPVLGEPHRP